MKKGLTELVFILDKSGSMGGLESDTIAVHRNSVTDVSRSERRPLTALRLRSKRVILGIQPSERQKLSV